MARGAEVQYTHTHRIRLRFQTGRLRVSTPLLGGIPLYKAVYLTFGGKVVETDSKQAKRKKKKKKNKAKTQVNVKQAPRAEAGRCRTLPPGAGPGPRAAATPSDKVSGDPKG